MNLTKIFELVQDEDEWLDDLSLKTKLCRINDLDSELVKSAKYIAIQFIDYLDSVSVKSLSRKNSANGDKILYGLYDPNAKDLKFDKKFSYYADDEKNKDIDDINIKELKNEVNRILSDYYKIFVSNSMFLYTEYTESSKLPDEFMYLEIHFD